MKKVDTNTVVAIAALVTSVVAVFIAWDEGRLQRRSQEAAFLPIIGIEGSVQTGETGQSVAVTLTNRGHGVAFVKAFSLSLGGRPLTSWSGFSEALLNDELAQSADFSWSDPVGYMQPGESEVTLRLQWPVSMAAAFADHFNDDALARIASFDAEVCYCSVFGSCWTTSVRGEPQPVSVDTCPADDKIVETMWGEFLETRRGDRP